MICPLKAIGLLRVWGEQILRFPAPRVVGRSNDSPSSPGLISSHPSGRPPGPPRGRRDVGVMARSRRNCRAWSNPVRLGPSRTGPPTAAITPLARAKFFGLRPHNSALEHARQQGTAGWPAPSPSVLAVQRRHVDPSGNAPQTRRGLKVSARAADNPNRPPAEAVFLVKARRRPRSGAPPASYSASSSSARGSITARSDVVAREVAHGVEGLEQGQRDEFDGAVEVSRRST